MKKIYMDFEMNMNNGKNKREGFKADLIAIGAIKYDTKTKKMEEFKSLIKPILTKTEIFGVDLYEVGMAQIVCDYFRELIAGPGAVRATLKKYVG